MSSEPPSDELIKARVNEILKSLDINTLSTRKLRTMLSDEFGCSMETDERKAIVRLAIEEFLVINIQRKTTPAAPFPDKATACQIFATPKPRPVKLTISKSGKPSEVSASASTTPSSNGEATSAAVKTSSGRQLKTLWLSDACVNFCELKGTARASHSLQDVRMKILAYAKETGLQEGSKIKCDEKLQVLFPKSEIKVFDIYKLLKSNKHYAYWMVSQSEANAAI